MTIARINESNQKSVLQMAQDRVMEWQKLSLEDQIEFLCQMTLTAIHEKILDGSYTGKYCVMVDIDPEIADKVASQLTAEGFDVQVMVESLWISFSIPPT